MLLAQADACARGGDKLNIIWSPVAEVEYLNILKYIIENWSLNDTDNFDDKTNSLIEKITTNHKLCPKSEINNFRKCVVTPQTSLIYRINSNSIEIISFISNYSQHKY
jgi:plasmid stabilization system protein ParE